MSIIQQFSCGNQVTVGQSEVISTSRDFCFVKNAHIEFQTTTV
jgi:hypothetical protein